MDINFFLIDGIENISLYFSIYVLKLRIYDTADANNNENLVLHSYLRYNLH